MQGDDEFWNIFGIKTSYYILGGISFVAALSWSNTVKETLDEAFPKPESKIHANFIYSIIITIILILLIYFMPDTESELPKGTQDKIKQEREKYILYSRINELENQVKNMKQMMPIRLMQ